jgi:hypothetical protein
MIQELRSESDYFYTKFESSSYAFFKATVPFEKQAMSIVLFHMRHGNAVIGYNDLAEVVLAADALGAEKLKSDIQTCIADMYLRYVVSDIFPHATRAESSEVPRFIYDSFVLKVESYDGGNLGISAYLTWLINGLTVVDPIVLADDEEDMDSGSSWDEEESESEDDA